MRPLLLALIVALGACGSDDEPAADTLVDTSTDLEAPATSAETTVVAASDPPATVPAPVTPTGTDEEAAVADLAVRQGVDPATITTVSVENVTWPDGSIGCPQPGVNYIQVLTDGVLVVLELDGTRYQYHGGGGQGVFLCENPTPPVGD